MAHSASPRELAAAEQVFAAGSHACYIFTEEAERRSVIGAFFAAGLAAGERVVYITDGTPAAEVRTWVTAVGVPGIDPTLVDVISAEAVYHPGGRFDPDSTIGRLDSANAESCRAGFPGRRSSAEMSWALRGYPGSDELVDYEARVNEMVKRYPVKPVCQYDARRFDGATLFRILQVHPMVLVRGQVVRNPYYRAEETALKP